VKTLFRLFVIALLALALWLAYSALFPLAPPNPQQFVLLKPGMSTRAIATELQRNGVVRDAKAFLVLHALNGRHTLKAGEYLFDKPESALDVYRRLARGDVYFHTIVIPEGFNIFDIASALEENGVCKREDFLRVAQTETSLVSDLAPQARTLEGYLYPDTYHLSRTQSPRDIAAAMVKRFRQEATSLGLTQDVHRRVTLASIVEKETSIPAERPLVAGVFENRLARRIGLATDPSVIYAALLAGRFRGAIHQSDLAFDSPYNTYKYAGLPPGPIANPGSESLKAAMNPAATDFIYFVANNKGGHNFARTIDEHNYNVAEYRRGLAAKSDK
jgi:UPF0755 protein